ncbi:MAG: dTMP kinase [Nitrososphaerota archaeon]
MADVRRGRLIAVEGVDGAGKTTQARTLTRWLNREGFRAVYTCEPTQGPVGRLVRKHLSGRLKLSEETVALLFAADRLEHLRTFVKPYLKRGFTIVSDRYLHSSIAYQTALTGRPDWVEQINGLAPEPDLSILLDVPVGMAIERLRLRRSERYERMRFLRRVRRNYLRLVRSGRMVLVDGRGGRGDVAHMIAEKVRRHLIGFGR